MLFRVFTVADSLDESENICEKLLDRLKKYINKKKYISNQRYWKIDNIFMVEINLKLCKKIPQSVLDEFILSISDKWKTYGNPVNEILISNTIEECNLKNKKIIMLNVFFQESEILNNY